MTALARFMANVVKQPDGCWLWTGAFDDKGYGLFQVSTYKGVRAYRWLWEQVNGSVPEGLELDHTCHNGSGCPGGESCPHRRCVNPAHLEAVTHRENVLRGQGLAAQNARKTHCSAGHRLQHTPDGKRRHCPTCSAGFKRAHKDRRREARLLALTGGAPRRCAGPSCTATLPHRMRIGTLYCSAPCRMRAFKTKVAA